MSTILVTLDGSALAERAIPHAVAQWRPGDRLVLVRITEPHYAEPGALFVTNVTDVGVSEARRYLAEQAQKLRERGLTVEEQVLVGLARDHIVAVAEREEADLIVMTSHGFTGSRRWLLGSVAESVAREAPCPVWLVRCQEPAEATEPQTERVMIALDTSERAEKGLDFAVDWLRQRPAELLLYSASGLGTDWSPETEARVGILATAREYLEKLRTRLSARGWQVRTLVEDLPAASGILDAAIREQVDLIVMTTHGRTGLDRWFMGSVAERVFRHAHCPVLLVNSQVKVSPVSSASY